VKKPATKLDADGKELLESSSAASGSIAGVVASRRRIQSSQDRSMEAPCPGKGLLFSYLKFSTSMRSARSSTSRA
jgi:hypothetical protein